MGIPESPRPHVYVPKFIRGDCLTNPVRLPRSVTSLLLPVRVVWVALLAIALWGIYYLQGSGWYELFLFPVAALTDIAFQRIRFDHLRLPEGALATAGFLILLFPPTSSLLLSGTATILALTLKHVIRRAGVPLFNPAALGVLAGAVFLGLAPSWWVGLGTPGFILLPVLGALIFWRNLSRWEVVTSFFLAYAGIASLYLFFFQQISTPDLFLLKIFDPATVFFGLYMVSEPRTSPADPALQPLFGAAVAIGSVGLSLVLPTTGVLVALIGGNVLQFVFRLRAAHAPAPSAERKKKRRHAPLSAAERWSIPRRASAGIAVLLLLGLVAASTGPSATPAPLVATNPTAPPSSGGSTTYSNCQADNPSIPSATLSQLHSVLGPSVILSYDANTGVVVFYDPVNHVTVTETDLYEDYGYAEFNGDDYAVSGCSP